MKKLAEHSNNFIYTLFCILFIIINLLLFFVDRNISYFNSQNAILPNIYWLFPILLIIFNLVKISFKKNNSILTLKNLIIAQGILLVIQLFISYNIYFYTGWDASTIRNTAFLMVEHPDQVAETFRNYYSFHVNQTTMAIILGLIMRFFYSLNINNFYFGTVIVNILIVNISGFLMTLSVFKLTQDKMTSFISWIIFLFLGSLSPWITIPYSDTFSMIFPILTFFIYLHLPKNQVKYIGWLGISFISIIGMLIKPQTIIVLIAILIVEFLFLFFDLTLKKIVNFGAIIGILLVSNFASNLIYSNSLKYIDFDIIPGRSFTYTHYLMTGLNPKTYGVYSDEDASLSYSTGSIEERESKNWDIIQKRINTMGLLGYLDFSQHKLLINFNDGSFAWGGEGGFYVEIFKEKTPLSLFLRSVYYHAGSLSKLFFQLTQIIWLMVIFLLPFNIIRNDKNNPYKLTTLITVIGITLFSHLFEARSRYLFSYLPFFVVAASLSIFKLKNLISKN